MNKFDKISLNLLLYLISFVISYAASDNFVAALFIGFLLWVLFNRLFIHFFNRYADKKNITVSRMEDLFALKGLPYQNDFFFSLAPDYFNPRKGEGYFIVTVNCVETLVFANFKFSPCSMDDIAKFYRTAKELNIAKVLVLSRLNPRNVVLFANSLDVETEFVSSHKVRKFLIKQNRLPEDLPKKEKKTPVDKREIIRSVFVRKRAKYFLISGITLAFLSLIGPMKIYYAVVSVICLAFALACLFREKIK